MPVRRPLPLVQADASLDPWCLVPVEGGDHIHSGFALRHPATGGLFWLVSSEVRELDEETGRARTRSGRRYQLGRRFEPDGVATEGLEAEIAFDTLCRGTPRKARDGRERGAAWVSCCKAARHLGLPAPPADAEEVRSFMARHGDEWVAHRRTWWGR